MIFNKASILAVLASSSILTYAAHANLIRTATATSSSVDTTTADGTIDDCASFATESSCVVGAGECAWHPIGGCTSSMVTERTKNRPPPLRGETSLKETQDSSLNSRALQKKTPPPTSSKPSSAPPTSANPTDSTAPSAPVPLYKNSAKPTPDRVADLLGRMTIAEKVGQMTQIEKGSISNRQDIASYFLGSLLSGGGGSPEDNSPQGWANMVDSFQAEAMKTRLQIPLIYGVDAVHGHSNVKGATIFPHNVGLGATRNATLALEIGKITAKEVYATGIPWNFAPCLAVCRDVRWGRCYESFGEHPEIASMMTTYIEGLEGTYAGGPGLGSPDTVLATPKHWLGDGGTTGGDDQGYTELPFHSLLEIHGEPYNNVTGALSRLAKTFGGSIMPSYSSVNFTDCAETPGQLKMHGHGCLINQVLRDEMGFKGFIISDWQGVDQLSLPTYADKVEASIKAGIDLVMVPYNYVTFTDTLQSLVSNGRITNAILDKAVGRILTAKFELGLFEKPYANRTKITDVGSLPHRQVAREAVAQSLVLLKNGDGIRPGIVLPITNFSGKKIVVAGRNSNNIGNQCGGWTITWQGSSGATTTGTTILQAIQSVVGSDATVEHAGDRPGARRVGDLGIVVVGELPYAEFQGDNQNLVLNTIDAAAVKDICSNMPCVVVLISGRPMIINAQLPQANAFVAAWLPGTEGKGVTDVLFGSKNFLGKLPMSWPRTMNQIPINVGDENYDPLFEYGFGLNYTQ